MEDYRQQSAHVAYLRYDPAGIKNSIQYPNYRGKWHRKELIAKAIHEESDRKNQPFVAINCGGIPENLLESELFGHKKGAFTGATNEKKGLFETAHKGTVFPG